MVKKWLLLFILFFPFALDAYNENGAEVFTKENAWYQEVIDLYCKINKTEPLPSEGMRWLVLKYAESDSQNKKCHFLSLLKKGLAANVCMKMAVDAAFEPATNFLDLKLISFFIGNKLVDKKERRVKAAFKKLLSLEHYPLNYQHIVDTFASINTLCCDDDAKDLILTCVKALLEKTELQGFHRGPVLVLKHFMLHFPCEFEDMAQDILKTKPAAFVSSFTTAHQDAIAARHAVDILEGTSLALPRFVEIACDKTHPHQLAVLKALLKVDPSLVEKELYKLWVRVEEALTNSKLKILDLRNWLKAKRGNCSDIMVSCALSYLDTQFAVGTEVAEGVVDDFQHFLSCGEFSKKTYEQLYSMCKKNKNVEVLQRLWHWLVEWRDLPDIAIDQVYDYFGIPQSQELDTMVGVRFKSKFIKTINEILLFCQRGFSNQRRDLARTFVRAAQHKVGKKFSAPQEDDTFMSNLVAAVAKEILFNEVNDGSVGLRERAQAFSCYIDVFGVCKGHFDKLFARYADLVTTVLDKNVASYERYNALNELTSFVHRHSEFIFPERIKAIAPKFFGGCQNKCEITNQRKVALSEDGKVIFVVRQERDSCGAEDNEPSLTLWALGASDKKILWKQPLENDSDFEFFPELVDVVSHKNQIMVTDGSKIWTFEDRTGIEVGRGLTSQELYVLKMKKLEEGQVVVVLGLFEPYSKKRYAKKLQIFSDEGELISNCELNHLGSDGEIIDLTETYLIRGCHQSMWLFDFRAQMPPLLLSLGASKLVNHDQRYCVWGRFLYYMRFNPVNRYEIVCYDLQKNVEKWFMDAHCDDNMHSLLMSQGGKVLCHMTPKTARYIKTIGYGEVVIENVSQSLRLSQAYSTFFHRLYRMDSQNGCLFLVNTDTGEEELFVEDERLRGRKFLGISPEGKALFSR